MAIKRLVRIPADSVELEGVFDVPENAIGLVIFAHGSGSGRLSTRNNAVATVLHDAGIGTLLFDLLTEEEDTVYEARFNIDLLAKRLGAAMTWIAQSSGVQHIPLGYFGASTGVAAALRAAADYGPIVSAVVSRGGRPDLAKDALARVVSPTLLIVGGEDTDIIAMNEQAFERIKKAEKKLEIVPGAGHLFEEPGAFETVSSLATNWFCKHLSV